MISTEGSHPDRRSLVAVARADSSALSPERRREVEELLTPPEPAHDPNRWPPEIYVGTNARVAANAFAATERWEEAWQVMSGAVPDDPSDVIEAAERGLLVILLGALHRGLEARGNRLIDDVEPLIQAGHRRSGDSPWPQAPDAECRAGSTMNRLIDDVEPLIQAGHRH